MYKNGVYMHMRNFKYIHMKCEQKPVDTERFKLVHTHTVSFTQKYTTHNLRFIMRFDDTTNNMDILQIVTTLRI